VENQRRDNAFHVLLAEDDRLTRRLLERTLHKAGYPVTSVANGLEALKAFNQSFFQIILTDWMMPEMDGLELCRTIREEKRDSGYVFIIIFTSKESKSDIVAGLEAGADDFLTKPVNESELIARLNTGKRILELERSLLDANKKIKKLSRTDSLTKCYNRTYLSERLPQEIKRVKRYDLSLSLILFDIDFFKKVNDTYGHLAGDKVLIESVACVNDSIREDIDWLARYGGEEFMVILPETDVDGACIVAERLRKAISNLEISVEGDLIHITASFGVTGFDRPSPDKDFTMETMIREVDELLYASKREGRNRVTAIEQNT
jgi:diguanylate cyclase (GGDEF)-like protein